MRDALLYLVINAGVVLLPFLFSFHRRIKFYRQWDAFLFACLIVLIPFIAWDIAFTERGVWGFNTKYVMGVRLWHLPLEEWMFFVCIPYACTFTFYCLGLMQIKFRFWRFYHFTAIAGVLFIVVAFVCSHLAYTFLTFLLAGIVMSALSLIKPVWFPRAVFTYLLILPFFFVSNGLLTGSWIPEEVVWYNPSENLGVRFGTIPVEDMTYGFSLVILNIFLFEQWRKLHGPAASRATSAE